MPGSFELTQLGLLLQKAGNAINDRITNQFNNLAPHQIQELANKAQDLFIKSKSMFAQATIELANELQDDLRKLQDATNEIQEAIKNIAQVQKVVNIATELVNIAGDVLAGDFDDTLDTIRKILNGISTPAA